MATVFSRIIAGELPARFVWQDERCVAFLSAGPLATGHTLVVPREEVDQWVDADPDLVAHLTRVAQAIGRVQVRAFGASRAGLMVAGYEIPHLHVHVWPSNSMRIVGPYERVMGVFRGVGGTWHDPDTDRG